MITFSSDANFNRLENFLKQTIEGTNFTYLDVYGQMGVEALKNATPKDSGETAESWRYAIVQDKDRVSISWSNDHIVDGYSVAVILQYGHGTRNGGYVEGIDYINPAMKPIFEDIAEKAWKEVSGS